MAGSGLRQLQLRGHLADASWGCLGCYLNLRAYASNYVEIAVGGCLMFQNHPHPKWLHVTLNKQVE